MQLLLDAIKPELNVKLVKITFYPIVCGYKGVKDCVGFLLESSSRFFVLKLDVVSDRETLGTH